MTSIFFIKPRSEDFPKLAISQQGVCKKTKWFWKRENWKGGAVYNSPFFCKWTALAALEGKLSEISVNIKIGKTDGIIGKIGNILVGCLPVRLMTHAMAATTTLVKWRWKRELAMQEMQTSTLSFLPIAWCRDVRWCAHQRTNDVFSAIALRWSDRLISRWQMANGHINTWGREKAQLS